MIKEIMMKKKFSWKGAGWGLVIGLVAMFLVIFIGKFVMGCAL